MTASFIEKSGYNIAYVHDSVPGAPMILFLPGYFSDMGGIKAVHLREEARRHGVGYASMDYMGHGQSGGDFLAGTISLWTQDVVDLIEHLNLKDIVLVGSSMGGWIALLLAKRIPERIRSIVGIASGPDFTEELIWPRLGEEKQKRLQAEGVLYAPSQYSEKGTPLTYKLIEDGRDNLVLREPLPWGKPLRLVHGTKDVDVPNSMCLKILDVVDTDDGQAIFIKDGDHRLSEPHYLSVISKVVFGLI